MADIGTAYVRVAPNMTGIQGKIAGGFKGTGTQVANQMGGEISGKSAALIGVVAGIASTAASKAMNMIASSIDGAVRRVDTLNNAARTFGFMGFEAENAEKATADLEKSITGLPTPLDSAMRGMTALAATYGDINKGQEVFSALNNAILGFGGTADQVDGAITQLSQLPMDGPLDAQTWNSLRNSGLTPLLVAMAKDSGMSVNEMKKAFGEGELTVEDFNKSLLKINKEGGGGLASLEEISKSATSGIGTSFANMQTAITRGLANIIDAIGQENIANAISAIGEGFESVLKIISNNLPKAIEAIKGFVDFIARNKDIFAPLAVGIGAVVAAITAWKTALAIWSGVTKTAAAVQAAFNAVMALNPAVVITLAIIGLVAALTYFFTKTETGKAIMESFGKVVSGVWESIKSGLEAVGKFFSKIWNGIKDMVSGVWKNIKQGASSMINGLVNFFGGLPGRIAGAVGNMGKLLYDKGRDLINGLIDGAGSLLKNIGKFFLDVIPGWIQTPFKKALGISSPSKVFANFGKDIDRGLAMGIEKNAGVVSKAVDTLSNNAIDGMTSPNISPSVAFGTSRALTGTGAGNVSNTNQSVNIEKVVLGDQGAAKEFFKQLNQDTINVGMGLTPIQGGQ